MSINMNGFDEKKVAQALTQDCRAVKGGEVMVDVIIDGEVAYCLPNCTCCTACHKLITEVEECPFPEPYGLWSDKYKCTPDCNYYHEIWDEKELKEELAKDEDKLLFDDEVK